jgi:hypothetical protein
VTSKVAPAKFLLDATVKLGALRVRKKP